MKRLVAVSTSPRLQVWIAGVSLVCWLVLSPVTMLTGLKSALWWITAASLFANVATCFGWWVTSLVQQRAERIEQSSTQTATLAHIEQMEARILQRLETADGTP